MKDVQKSRRSKGKSKINYLLLIPKNGILGRRINEAAYIVSIACDTNATPRAQHVYYGTKGLYHYSEHITSLTYI